MHIYRNDTNDVQISKVELMVIPSLQATSVVITSSGVLYIFLSPSLLIYLYVYFC